MNRNVTTARIGAGLIVVLCAWVVHGFMQALLAAAVAAIASWPLYKTFATRMPGRLRGTVSAALFTSLIAVVVFAPMLFAIAALLGEVHTVVQEILAADQQGIAAPPFLQNVPWLGPWAAARWQSDLTHPGALLVWAQRADSKAFVGWAQSLGQFAGRHAFIMVFGILLLLFLYQEGESLGRDCTRLLRATVGPHADRYLDVLVQAVRASVTSMVLVGLFDAFFTGFAFAIAGAPRAAQWGAIIGALAAVPFLGYVAVVALALRLAIEGQAALGVFCLTFGCLVLLFGDKILRPSIAREGVRLPFVWVLMGCIGGFQVLGLVGLVIGPVALALARELWDQRLEQLSPGPAGTPVVSLHRSEVSSCNRPNPLPTVLDVS